MSLTSVRVGGVPEHFNYPWHLAKDAGAFLSLGIDLKWTNYSTGTGAMVGDLENNDLDMAVLLSEGAVAAVSQGQALRVLGWTVSTPLVWGVHVAPSITAATLSELQTPRIAISRFGSGSHLMAHVLMQREGLQQAWRSHDFVVVNNLPGAADAFANDQADLFMWEQFTTQPSVDAGHMRRIATCPTPWPPFCLVASEKFLAQAPTIVDQVMQCFYESARQAQELSDLTQRIALHYALKPTQVDEWRKITRWTIDNQIDPAQVSEIIDKLAALDLARNDLAASDCLR
ncbi:MAG: ABC transporter substrate-binding protein [Lysobacterales bacterium]